MGAFLVSVIVTAQCHKLFSSIDERFPKPVTPHQLLPLVTSAHFAYATIQRQ